MAKKFLTDIDLSKNELLNAVMQNLTTAPSSPKTGQLYYNTNDLVMFQWDGTAWKPVGSIYTNGNGIVISSNVVSADFATSNEATAGTSTTKVMSPALVKAVIETLDVTGFSQGVVGANGDKITITGIKETDGKIAVDSSKSLEIKIDTSHAYDATTSPLATTGTVAAAQTASAVTLETGSESATNFVSYTVKQGGTTVGTINIPKFLVVKDGTVVTGTWSGTTFTEDDPQPGSGTGKAIKLVLNDSGDAGTADDVLYINVADLVDVYTGSDGIEVTAANVIKAKLASYTAHTNASALPTNTAGRQYPVGIDSNGKLSVNVPWSDTTYTNATLGQGYAECETAAATAAKVANLEGYTLTDGGIVAVYFLDNVGANASLNINSQGAKPILYQNNPITANIIQRGDTALFMYNGEAYVLLAIDRLCKAAVTGIEWTSGSHNVTITYADGTTSSVAIHPTHTAYTGKPTADQTPGFGDTFTLSQVKTNDFGHVTEMNDRTVTIPNATATTSAAGLMSAADKTKLDGMTYAVNQYSIANAALTYNSTTGTCTWTIASSSVGNAPDLTKAMCSLRDSNGDEVFADVRFATASITITINASANIAAGAYTANIMVPVNL